MRTYVYRLRRVLGESPEHVMPTHQASHETHRVRRRRVIRSRYANVDEVDELVRVQVMTAHVAYELITGPTALRYVRWLASHSGMATIEGSMDLYLDELRAEHAPAPDPEFW
jgi:hypothetical protein